MSNTDKTPSGPARPGGSPPARHPSLSRWWLLLGVALGLAIITALVVGLLVSITERRWEARHPFVRQVPVDEHTIDPALWGANWPHQYDSYRRTVDYERTRYGGSDAVPTQMLEKKPWLRTMWAGYAFSLDYRESRGHAFMLHDQDHTERVAQRPQPGACLHCHASILPAYRHAGGGLDMDNVMKGFGVVNAMSWNEARALKDAQGNALVTHPITCLDCHDPETMSLRVTRPAFLVGIQALARSDAPVPHLPSIGRWREGDQRTPYDPNAMASRHELRSFTCTQCHVEYYFTPAGDPRGKDQLVYPWHKGLSVDAQEAYYDEIGFHDWTHAITGGSMLKAQHPEFEMWSQGIHAQAGVSCADCHMPYERVGAMKVSNHHVRSPLLNVAASCQVCHNVAEQELLRRAHTIQDRTNGLIERSSEALVSVINAISAAREAGASDEQLREARQLHRRAQWRIDWVYSEGSMGFHASQEAARVLAEAIDHARQGEIIAQRLLERGAEPARLDPEKAPLEGVTPRDKAPPDPRTMAPSAVDPAPGQD